VTKRPPSVIRVGLVGAGPWARLFTAPLLTSSEGLSLSAVWARRTAAAEELAHEHNTVAVPSFNTLLGACDAIAFSVPADVQAPLAVAAARAGKDLLLEKPVAFTVREAEEVARAADASGVVTQLMLTYRFTEQVRAFLSETSKSRVSYVRVAFVGGGALPGSPFATPWRRKPGAALVDLGPHVLDLAEAVAGPIRELAAREDGGVVSLSTTHADGGSGHLAISGTTPGGAGRLESDAVNDGGRPVLDDPSVGKSRELFAAVTAEFVRAVRDRASGDLDVHRGAYLQRIVSEIGKSIATGRSVKVC
jgi:predicted dehydrogenase